MKRFKFESKEIDDIDLGVMGVLPWQADVNIIGESVLVIRAVARKWNGTALREIDITPEVQEDRDLKELIHKQWRRECEKSRVSDEDRAYDEFKDNGDGAA